ncbi:COX15/CtaA family protein [Segetibacter koreensis]|uniref:COX15/CtaA family protein n=1 Tax=Segetibacter koreensis TaxID=398037 RepID=UPI00035D1B34|nr:COX15/CtaA family protein [Segetibacter koreensis]
MHHDKSTKIVAYWIFLGVGMLIVQVLLGGITRLTGSGLSITEWKPIMGAMPPMGEAEWQQAFHKYQQIAQYKYINEHFTLSNFKFIFFWEWFHRLWARLIGVVFLIPFIYFLVKKYFKSWMVFPLVILFLLGALQGAIGWIMVKSGLNDSDVYVNHIRLATHFMAAMVLICYALLFGLKLVINPRSRIAEPALLRGAIVITVLVCIQLVFGAFMAGLKAAATAPTWPDINGMIIPEGLFSNGGFFYNIAHNKITIHFIHRTLAYIIVFFIVIWWYNARSVTSSAAFNKAKNLTFFLVITQVCLGIFTVLNGNKIVAGKFGAFEWLAELHQLTGMLLLLSLIAVIYMAGKKHRTI